MKRFWHALGAPFRALAAFIGWMRAAVCALLTPEGRRGWAVIIAFGCGVAMTGLATAAMYLDRDKPGYVFWLGTEAMGIILVVITAFTSLLVKRDIGGSVKLPGGGEGSLNFHDTGGGENGPAA